MSTELKCEKDEMVPAIKRIEPMSLVVNVLLDEECLSEDTGLPCLENEFFIGETMLCYGGDSVNWGAWSLALRGGKWHTVSYTDPLEEWFVTDVKISYFEDLAYIETCSDNDGYATYSVTIKNLFDSLEKLAKEVLPLIRIKPIINENGCLTLATNLTNDDCPTIEYEDFEAFYGEIVSLNAEFKDYLNESKGRVEDFIAQKGFYIGKPEELIAEVIELKKRKKEREEKAKLERLKEELARYEYLKTWGCEGFSQLLAYNQKSKSIFADNAQIVWEGEDATCFSYRDQNHNLTERKVTLKKVLKFNENFYLVGQCHLRNEERMFRLDRIEMNSTDLNILMQKLGINLPDS